MADEHVTQLLVEVLVPPPASPAQASQVACEVVFANANEACIDQLACELLIIRVPERTGPRTSACPAVLPLA